MGQFKSKYTGLIRKENDWYYIENGAVNWGYTGLVRKGDDWYYVENGVFKPKYTGLVKKEENWFYVEMGQFKPQYTELVRKENDWYYVENGAVNWKYTGLIEKDNTWLYVQEGKFRPQYTGLVRDMKKKNFRLMLIAGHGQGDSGAVGNGYWESDLTRDLVKRIETVAMSKGISTIVYDMDKNAVKQIRAGNIPLFSGNNYCLEVHFNASSKSTSRGSMFYIHKNENGWSVENNILQRLYNLGSKKAWDGVVKANRQWEKGLLVQNNSIRQGVPHGLLETCFISNKDDVNWYLENSNKIAEQVIEALIDSFGLVEEEKWTGYKAGTWYYVENGAVRWDYTGVVSKGENWYYVERGTINWKFSGIKKSNNKEFTIKNGVATIK